jgi:predicted membrane-bound spermidine synthase
MGENWQYGMKVEFQVTKVLADEQMSKCHMKYVETPCHGKVLLMDGEVQFSTADEDRYGEMMMWGISELPYSLNQPPKVDILVLGGGDGLLARDLLKQCIHPQITIVDWDAKFVAWASDIKNLPENKGSLNDPRVRVLDMDVRDPRILEEGKKYDVVILDLPDPDSKEMQDVYTYVVKTVLPAVAKSHVTIKAHVGPAVLSNKKHPNWAFIETFQLDMEDMFYKTGRRSDYKLEVDYIPSYMHEWGFVFCVAWMCNATN